MKKKSAVWNARSTTVVSRKTAKTMARMLENVVTEGTGKVAAIPGYRVAGKTGTAERAVNGGYSGYSASFIGFAPADDPDLQDVKPVALSPSPPARSTRVRRGYMDLPFGQLHYLKGAPDQTPRGRPVLCLHASPRSGRDFGLIPEVLGRDRIVLAPDMPGLGGSSLPATPMTIEAWATTMLAFLDRMEIDQVDVFGYHTGSVTAVALALAAP